APLLTRPRGARVRALEDGLAARLVAQPGDGPVVLDWLRPPPGAGAGAVEVRVHGPDLDRLDDLARQAARLAGTVPGVAGVHPAASRVPEVVVAPDREAMARHGLAPAELSLALEAAGDGHRVAGLAVGRDLVPVVLRLGAARANGDPAEPLRTLVIPRPGGGLPLASVAALQRSARWTVIAREGQQRVVELLLGIRAADPAKVVTALRARLAALPRPPGYTVTVEEPR
ncbi:MAG TPA: efflux RND transporter permease subunit, partial [Polyangia bacterium]